MLKLRVNKTIRAIGILSVSVDGDNSDCPSYIPQNLCDLFVQ